MVQATFDVAQALEIFDSLLLAPSPEIEDLVCFSNPDLALLQVTHLAILCFWLLLRMSL